MWGLEEAFRGGWVRHSEVRGERDTESVRACAPRLSSARVYLSRVRACARVSRERARVYLCACARAMCVCARECVRAALAEPLEELLVP